MLEACVSPEVDFTAKRAGRPTEPSRPLQLTRAEEEVHACLRGEVERLKKLKNEANRLRRGYRREMITCRYPTTKRKGQIPNRTLGGGWEGDGGSRGMDGGDQQVCSGQSIVG
eukprot:9094675-Pyramimonas_sp.AAC.1